MFSEGNEEKKNNSVTRTNWQFEAFFETEATGRWYQHLQTIAEDMSVTCIYDMFYLHTEPKVFIFSVLSNSRINGISFDERKCINGANAILIKMQLKYLFAIT